MKGFNALLISILIKTSEGAMDIVFSENPATVGDAVTITCTKSSALEASVSWLNQRFEPITLSLCLHTEDECNPSISNVNGRYFFNSDFANRKFTMSIFKVEQADAGVYTCKDSSPDEGNATLKVQTDDGGLTGGAIAGIVAVVLILGVGLPIGILCYTGYFPGWWWSATVLIPQKKHPNIKFEDVLSFAIRKEIMEETGTSINLRGEGSVMCRRQGQDDSRTNMPVEDQPQQDEVFIMSGTDQPLEEIYVTAVFKIRVKRAVKKIEKIIKEAIIIRCSVPIPDYPDIKFEEVLNHQVLERLERETGSKVIISGRGSREYGKYGGHQLHSDMPLQVCITSDKPEQVKQAYDKIVKIIKEATSKHGSVQIWQKEFPGIKFEDVLNLNILKRVETETRSKIVIYGEGSIKYGTYGEPLRHLDIPLQVSITSDNPEDVIQACYKIMTIISEAIIIHQCDKNNNSVRIPQEDYPEIKFNEVLNDHVLKGVKIKTGIEIIKYDRDTECAFIFSDNQEQVQAAKDQLKKIIENAINKLSTVLIPQERYPDKKFEQVLNEEVLRNVEEQTETEIRIYGEGSDKYGKCDKPDPYQVEPLHISIICDNPYNIKRAKYKLVEIIEEAINNHTVLIPQERYPEIKFKQALNKEVLRNVEEQTETEIRIYGEGSDKYGKYGKCDSPDPYHVETLHISIISDNPDNIKRANYQVETAFQNRTYEMMDNTIS